MSLFICSINSGSNANCYYVSNEEEAVLIDAGLSCRETERRMQQRGLQMEKVKAIFVSHEHTDHTKGINNLSKKYKLPLYVTPLTLTKSSLSIDKELLRTFKHNQTITIGNLFITAFSKYHDAADPHSFLVHNSDVTIGIITDIGHACTQVIKAFKKCNAVFLESNYCEDMLAAGSYPYPLKKRISSEVGHLSNSQALALFKKHKPQHLQLLILSHLSQNNNQPDVVAKLFAPHAGSTKVIVASRYTASDVYPVKAGHSPTIKYQPEQLKLF
jgi:phosphoribosyl 1,2-cyclic phosphodiesterase